MVPASIVKSLRLLSDLLTVLLFLFGGFSASSSTFRFLELDSSDGSSELNLTLFFSVSRGDFLLVIVSGALGEGTWGGAEFDFSRKKLCTLLRWDITN